MEKILVTGANGQVASELKELAVSISSYEYIFLAKEQLDITNRDAVLNYFNDHKPAYCINCSAYTAVDQAETDVQTAFDVNAKGAGNLAEACECSGAKLLHISTDYVYDGNAQHEYSESDPVHPLNVYGESKLAGEQAILSANPSCVILRTSWVYSAYGKNFVKTMLRLLKERNEIGVVADQYGNPTYAKDLAEAIMHIIDSRKWTPGVYHYSNEGVISWFDFACEIKKLIHSSCQINPLRTDEYPVKAVRPKYSGMKKQKIVTTYEVPIKDWKNSLKHCVERLSN
jgi:dTDP-4-dehydrorhamnose reductase